MVISGDVGSWGRSCVFKLGKITVREVCGEELTSLGGRWGGGSGWGTHVHPWLTHVTVWQKPLQYCKVISFQLK